MKRVKVRTFGVYWYYSERGRGVRLSESTPIFCRPPRSYSSGVALISNVAGSGLMLDRRAGRIMLNFTYNAIHER